MKTRIFLDFVKLGFGFMKLIKEFPPIYKVEILLSFCKRNLNSSTLLTDIFALI
jgi:hypothetical protein